MSPTLRLYYDGVDGGHGDDDAGADYDDNDVEYGDGEGNDDDSEFGPACTHTGSRCCTEEGAYVQTQ